MRPMMLQIVRFFLYSIVGFCLTISSVWADEAQIVLPKVIIDFSGVAASIYQQQAILWLFASLVAIFVGFIAYVLLNKAANTKAIQAEKLNVGDIAAKNASLIWLIFLVLFIAGLSVPILRLWLVLNR